jgi:LytS/YehU family sensor histidine kinase
MAHNESLRLHIDVDTPELPIAPLLLMPLVENTFKHVGDLSQPDAICISLTVTQRHLLLATDNVMKAPTAPASSARSTGVGLSVLRRRLDLLYPGRHSLTTSSAEGRYRTKLSIQL